MWDPFWMFRGRKVRVGPYQPPEPPEGLYFSPTCEFERPKYDALTYLEGARWFKLRWFDGRQSLNRQLPGETPIGAIPWVIEDLIARIDELERRLEEVEKED